MADILPAIFFGHGNPMNAVLENEYTDGWRRIVQYPAPGDLDLARRVQTLLAPLPVRLDTFWGLDHGTWSVLRHAYPAADIPIVQLSIDETRASSFHYEIGRRLAPLRAEGVLIVGSGNLVHNLHAYAWGRHTAEPYDGRLGSRRTPEACCWRAMTDCWSTTSRSVARRCCRSPRPIITSRCCT